MGQYHIEHIPLQQLDWIYLLKSSKYKTYKKSKKRKIVRCRQKNFCFCQGLCLIGFLVSGGPRSSGVGFFCFHALGDTKQKKPTPLDRSPTPCKQGLKHNEDWKQWKKNVTMAVSILERWMRYFNNDHVYDGYVECGIFSTKLKLIA